MQLDDAEEAAGQSGATAMAVGDRQGRAGEDLAVEMGHGRRWRGRRRAGDGDLGLVDGEASGLAAAARARARCHGENGREVQKKEDGARRRARALRA
jgi:hypothetical protein